MAKRKAAPKKKAVKHPARKKPAAKKPPAKLLPAEESVPKRLNVSKRKAEKHRASDPAAAHQFTPPPKYPSKWWKRYRGNEDLMQPVYDMDHQSLFISDKTWVVIAYLSQGPGSDETFAIFFPTATDCLLWFRWEVMTYQQSNEEDTESDDESESVADLIETIDKAKPGADAARLLISLKDDLFALPVYLEFQCLQSIHEYLSDLCSVAAWRRALQSDEVTCQKGHWSMPSTAWQSLQDVLEPVWSGEADSIDPSTVYIDDENAVFDQLGGGEEVSRQQKVFRLHDGRLIRMVCAESEKPNPNYSFHVSPESWKEAHSIGCTHIGFIMGIDGFAIVPMDVLKKQITTRSLNHNSHSNNTQDAYEIAITPPPHVMLKGHSGGPDVNLSKYFQERTY